MEKLLDKTEVCEFLGISRPTLDRIVAAGELEALRIRGQVRFSREEILKYLGRCRKPRAIKNTPAPRKEPGRPGRPRGSRKEHLPQHYYPGMKVV